MIDVDIGEWELLKKTAAFLELTKKLQALEATTGIKPRLINETYKGYHILFKFSEELHRTKIPAYKHIYSTINTLLGGDKNFKEITGMLKVPGFIDHKNNRDFLIQTIQHTTASASDITLDTVMKCFYAEGIEIKTVVKKSQHQKEEKIEQREVDEVDAKLLLQKINESHSARRRWFQHKVFIQSDGISIDKTSGLRLFYDDKLSRWVIKDFAQKGRYGNYNFLLNYYFQCSWVRKTQRFEYMRLFFKREFGINVEQRSLFKKSETLFSLSDEIVAFPLRVARSYLSKTLLDKNWDGIKFADIKKYLKICDLRPLKIDLGTSTHKKNQNAKKQQNLQDYAYIWKCQKLKKSELPISEHFFLWRNKKIFPLSFQRELLVWELFFMKREFCKVLLGIRSEEKFAFALDVFIWYYLYGGYTLKLNGYKNKKYYYEILRSIHIKDFIPDYKIVWSYLYAGSKEWVKSK